MRSRAILCFLLVTVVVRTIIVVVVVPKMLLPNLATSGGILELQYLIRFTIRMLILVIFKSITVI